MKIYTEVNYRWDGDQLVLKSEESYEYSGEIAECSGGGGGGQKQTWEASNKYAALSRQQFKDLKNRFYPYHQKLISEANGATMAEEVGRATEATQAASTRQQNAMELGASRMGTTMNNAQQASTDRTFKLNNAASLANAKNKAREKVEARDLAVNTGGMGAINKAKGA